MAVRFALLYDTVTTWVFPGLTGDRMALKLNGKDDRLTHGDFMTLARTIGLSQGAAEAAIRDMTTSLAKAVDVVRLPEFAATSSAATAVQGQVLALANERSAALAKGVS